MRLCLSLIFILSWAACTNKNSLPGDILPQSKMQELVWDVMVADECSKEMMIMDTARSKNIKKERSALYQEVFNLHLTNRNDFLKSFNYYTSHPDLAKVLFDTLAIRANRKREEDFHIKMVK